jgi:hypothetical protein
MVGGERIIEMAKEGVPKRDNFGGKGEEADDGL